MKRDFLIYGLLLCFILMGAGCGTSDEGGDVVHPAAGQHRSWTFLFYDDADFTYAFDPWQDFITRMYSSDQLHVLVLRDQMNIGGGIHYVNPDMSTDLLKSMEILNMGSAATLSDFINFAKTRFPAQRTVIAFYDHGSGFLGACTDNSHNDWLDMAEIRQGLEESGGVDMVLFSAPCLMGAVESMYELRNQTEVYIGSEHLSGYCFWRHPMAGIRDILTRNPGISTRDLGARIISLIRESLPLVDDLYPDTSRTVTMSAVRSDRLDALVSVFQEITYYYWNRPDRFKGFLDGNYQNIETYQDFNMDLFSLSSRLMASETDTFILSKLGELQNRIRDAVIAEVHGSDFPDSHGIALFCPNHQVQNYYPEDYQEVAFASATRWDEILEEYFRSLAATTPDSNSLRQRYLKTGSGEFPREK